MGRLVYGACYLGGSGGDGEKMITSRYVCACAYALNFS